MLPQQPAPVLISPNSKLFGSKLHATTIKKTNRSRLVFFRPSSPLLARVLWRGAIFGIGSHDIWHCRFRGVVAAPEPSKLSCPREFPARDDTSFPKLPLARY